jgi:hypothetical protein
MDIVNEIRNAFIFSGFNTYNAVTRKIQLALRDNTKKKKAEEGMKNLMLLNTSQGNAANDNNLSNDVLLHFVPPPRPSLPEPKTQNGQLKKRKSYMADVEKPVTEEGVSFAVPDHGPVDDPDDDNDEPYNDMVLLNRNRFVPRPRPSMPEPKTQNGQLKKRKCDMAEVEKPVTEEGVSFAVPDHGPVDDPDDDDELYDEIAADLLRDYDEQN